MAEPSTRSAADASEALALLGVDCVTLVNNHVLDYGAEALLDTLEHLRAGEDDGRLTVSFGGAQEPAEPID